MIDPISKSPTAVLDFLEDCASVRGYFEYDVDQHRELLAELISCRGVPSTMTSLANTVLKALSIGWGHPLGDDEGRELAGKALSSIQRMSVDLGRPLYVFHGTTAGRLEAIALSGIVPGSSSPWRGVGENIELQCSEYAFFTEAWTHAIDFAQIAHHRSRGPKTGWARAPVVLRLPVDGLTLERDPLATKPGCLRARGSVSAVRAEVRLSPFTGISSWLPIGTVSRSPATQREA